MTTVILGHLQVYRFFDRRQITNRLIGAYVKPTHHGQLPL